MQKNGDDLELQISASVKKAEKAIDSLVSKLEVLEKSLTGVSAGGATSTANAFANMTKQTNALGKSTKSFVSSMNKTDSAMRKTQKSAWSLASAFGKFYASYFMVIRGIKGLWNSIESTTDYIEAFNYFDVAFGKIASEWDKDFERFGYENAQAYAESFTKRMTDSMGDLSGLRLDADKGLLTASGTKNLALNIQEITQSASQLASITNSIGLVGEVSLEASDSFTKLAADMSSLFNIDFSSAMKNLQSGLIGQSRALYKYGIDITNATLQTYAYELGLSKAVSEMTQAEKMQLRMIAILDQSKVAWGDLANTINSPSNMIRQFTNNLKEAGMVLGQLFIPMLQKLLPVLNGITIALKTLLVNIASFLGITLDLSSFGQGYSDIGEDVEGVADGLEDATAAAKKFKSVTLGIDELNINSPQDDSSASVGGAGGGIDLTGEILKATEEYQNAWNEAFANMENKAQDVANKIFAFFNRMGEVIRNVVDTIAYYLNPLFEVFSNDIMPSLIDGWHRFVEIIKPFTDFVANVFSSYWNDIIIPVLEYFGNTVIPTIAKTLSNLWKNIIVPVATFIGNILAPVIETISYYLDLLLKNIIVPLTEFVGNVLAAAFEGYYGILNNLVIPAVGNVIKGLNILIENVIIPLVNILKTVVRPVFESVFGTIKNLIKSLQTIMVGLINFITGTFSLEWGKAWNGIKDVFRGIMNSVIDIFEGILNFIIGGLQSFLNGFVGTISEIGGVIGIDIKVPQLSTISLPRFANGGFPEDGLFMANHNELVGSFSNGRTAVANNEQIVAGIKEGVREAVSEVLAPYLADIVQNTRETADKDLTVAIGDREIARANARGQRSMGFALITE